MENFSLVGLNVFDIVIGSLVLVLGIKGFLHGFLKELFSLVGLLGGIYLAFLLAGNAANFIGKNFLDIENASLLRLIGFVAIFVIVWLSATILGSIFHKLRSETDIGIISRIMGYIAGAAKYFIIFALIVAALSNVSLAKDKLGGYVKSSILYPHLVKIGSAIINLDSSAADIQASRSHKTDKK